MSYARCTCGLTSQRVAPTPAYDCAVCGTAVTNVAKFDYVEPAKKREVSTSLYSHCSKILVAERIPVGDLVDIWFGDNVVLEAKAITYDRYNGATLLQVCETQPARKEKPMPLTNDPNVLYDSDAVYKPMLPTDWAKHLAGDDITPRLYEVAIFDREGPALKLYAPQMRELVAAKKRFDRGEQIDTFCVVRSPDNSPYYIDLRSIDWYEDPDGFVEHKAAHKTTNPHWMTDEQLVQHYVDMPVPHGDRVLTAAVEVVCEELTKRALNAAAAKAISGEPWKHLLPKRDAAARDFFVGAARQRGKTAAIRGVVEAQAAYSATRTEPAPAPREVADHVWDMIKKDHHEKRRGRIEPITMTDAERASMYRGLDRATERDRQANALDRAASVPLPGDRSMRAVLLSRED